MRMLGYENQRKKSYSFANCITSIKSCALLIYLNEDFTFHFEIKEKKVASTLHNPYAMDHTLVNNIYHSPNFDKSIMQNMMHTMRFICFLPFQYVLHINIYLFLKVTRERNEKLYPSFCWWADGNTGYT